MKKMLFLLLLLPAVVSFGQKDKYLQELLGLKPDSNCKLIRLPELRQSDLSKVFEAGRKSANTYIVSHDSIYYRIFSLYHPDSLPRIDFTNEEMLIQVACSQCLVFCRHYGPAQNEPCHRNACGYSIACFVRKRVSL